MAWHCQNLFKYRLQLARYSTSNTLNNHTAKKKTNKRATMLSSTLEDQFCVVLYRYIVSHVSTIFHRLGIGFIIFLSCSLYKWRYSFFFDFLFLASLSSWNWDRRVKNENLSTTVMDWYQPKEIKLLKKSRIEWQKNENYSTEWGLLRGYFRLFEFTTSAKCDMIE